MNHRDLISLTGLLAGITHIILAGALVRQPRPCTVCILAFIVGIGISGCALVLARMRMRIGMISTITLTIVFAIAGNPYTNIERLIMGVISR
ncbi:MAG: hypothetical protein HY665_04010 [Chloroflexi bacterium]|nr:hypothetical protein [Chloroflexota bacterium]